MKWNLTAKIGSYQNNSGETKTRWQRLGQMRESKNGGFYLLIDPTVDIGGVFSLQQKQDPSYDSVMVGVFEENDAPKKAKPKQSKNKDYKQTLDAMQQLGDGISNELDDDIPF